MMENSGQLGQVRNNSRVLRPGDHLFREGEEPDALYVVRSGSVKSYLITEDGEEQVLGFYLPGDVLGLDGLGNSACISSAVTLETSSICRLPFAQLSERGCGRVYPKLISDQLAREHNLILMLARKDADGKLASFLWDLSRRFKQIGYAGSAFKLSMSRQDIGNYLGLVIETVSRTLTRFQESGLLGVSRRMLEIHDLEALKHIAGGQASH
ncbi:MAG: cyclic nucleotide-binding domain-containing protein [Gammaproteobacteria bacterium]